MEIVFPCQMITENIFKEHLWGKCCNSLAFCALFNFLWGWKLVNFQFTAAILFHSLEKTPLPGALLSYLRDTTALIGPELPELSTSENLAQVVMLKYDGL